MATVKNYGAPIAAWEEKIAAMKAGGKSGPDALRALASKEPDLHRRYVEAYNAQHGRPGRTL